MTDKDKNFLIMKIFRGYKKTKFFLFVNILGLATGLAAAIMLILFVVNEYSYDRHFAAADRIVALNTAFEEEDTIQRYPIDLRTAYTDLPPRVAGVEAAVQIYDSRGVEVRNVDERIPDINLLYADPEFFKVFDMKFVEGTARALEDVSSIVLTRPRAEAMFGGAAEAIGKTLKIEGTEHTVTAVVEPLPLNTHFSFDMLANMETSGNTEAMGLEFFSFYLIEQGQSLTDVRAALEKEYTELLKPWAEYFTGSAWGETELLTDIYLKGTTVMSLGKRNSMGFIWMLSALALVILMFAITNFINLFTAQGETRMKEIAVRKTHGAGVTDLVRQLFAEVGVLVAVAFALGMVLATQLTPAFAALIQKEIDIRQFLDPVFVGCIAGLFVVTVVLSAAYTSFYLSRQNPLDIFGRRLKLAGNRWLSTVIVCFQSAVTIALIAFIIVVNRQADWLKDIPLGYNPRGVMTLPTTPVLRQNHEAVLQELSALPIVEAAAGSQHIIGASPSGQSIKRLGSSEGSRSINEYRIFPGYGELMQLQLAEGEFVTPDTPGTAIVVNRATVEMLDLQHPVAGQQVDYRGTPATIVGVVEDFVYGEPGGVVQPLVLAAPFGRGNVSVRLRPGTDRLEAQAAVQTVMRRFDPDYVVSPLWSEDIYNSKFADINNQGRILLVGSLLSVLIAVSGLLAIHLYSAMRRTKEIGIRRIHGASRGEIFALLSRDTLRWTLVAGVIAVPAAWWLVAKWFASMVDHVALDWSMFIVPVVIQLVVALAVTSGVSFKVASSNPVKSLKSE
jgi:putative ABC transport system permease protein